MSDQTTPTEAQLAEFAYQRAPVRPAKQTPPPGAMPEHRKWLLHLICCGRDDGTWPCASWEEADAIRTSYIDPSTGHDRSAVITVRGAVLPTSE